MADLNQRPVITEEELAAIAEQALSVPIRELVDYLLQEQQYSFRYDLLKELANDNPVFAERLEGIQIIIRENRIESSEEYFINEEAAGKAFSARMIFAIGAKPTVMSTDEESVIRLRPSLEQDSTSAAANSSNVHSSNRAKHSSGADRFRESEWNAD